MVAFQGYKKIARTGEHILLLLIVAFLAYGTFLPREDTQFFLSDTFTESSVLYFDVPGLIRIGGLSVSRDANPCPRPLLPEGDAFLFPVNKESGLDSFYVPYGLAPLPRWMTWNTNPLICLREDAREKLVDFFLAAEEAGYTLEVTSGYRSYDTQSALRRYYTSTMGLEETDRASAPPGHSEHQLGTTVDITGKGQPSTNHNFANTAEGTWALLHAGEYGFILSYPEDKESVTGYKYEPWHLRYVGVEEAQKVLGSGTTLTEYLIARNTSQKSDVTVADY